MYDSGESFMLAVAPALIERPVTETRQ